MVYLYGFMRRGGWLGYLTAVSNILQVWITYFRLCSVSKQESLCRSVPALRGVLNEVHEPESTGELKGIWRLPATSMEYVKVYGPQAVVSELAPQAASRCSSISRLRSLKIIPSLSRRRRCTGSV